MKELVSTRTLNGIRKNDHYSIRDGAIVVPALKLELGEYADDDVGNARSFFSLLAEGRTTTAQVIFSNSSESVVVADIEAWLQRVYPDCGMRYPKKATELFRRVQLEMASIPVGCIVEVRDLRIIKRTSNGRI